jgi:filamentous hemagglutinin
MKSRTLGAIALLGHGGRVYDNSRFCQPTFDTGAGVALSAEVNNGQLHPDEIAYKADKADEFAAQAYGCEPGTCSPQQVAAARDRLITEAAQRVDGVMATRIGGDDKEAEGFINANPIKFGWGEGFTATREQYNDFRYFGELLSQNKQSLAAIAQALGAAGWTKKDFQEAYNPQLLALANKARGDDGRAVLEMFSGDVGMGLGIVAKVINGDIKGAAADAALAALPWGVVKALRPIMPVADAGGGLIWVNGKKLEAHWLNEKGELTWIDPLTNKREVVPDNALLERDHMLPKNEILGIDNFRALPKALQKEILEDPRNYQPMLKSPNCSKGCKTEGVDGGWSIWNGKPVSAAYKARIEMQQTRFREQVEQRIAQYRAQGE